MSRRPGGQLAECNGCGLPITFVRLDTGSLMPVNPRPNAAGNVSAHRSGQVLVGFVITAARPTGPADDRYMTHHATCDARPSTTPAEPPVDPDIPLF